MKSIDQYYTPGYLADQMVSAVVSGNQAIIADFAAGDGRLLVAAQSRWPLARIVANDLSQDGVKTLESKFASWDIGNCDFTDAASRYQCQIVSRNKGQISLVLLNPPFSFRGTKFWRTQLEGQDIRCSIALAFVINSLEYLADNGEVVAILPEGCLYNESDDHARAVLRKYTKIKIIEHNDNRTFPGCNPRTVIARFTKLAKPQLGVDCKNSADDLTDIALKKPSDRYLSVMLIRGKLPMNKTAVASNDTLPLVHSTELTETGVNLSARVFDRSAATIAGPAILLPRVGSPNLNKVQLYLEDAPIILSDCVIAVCCSTGEDAKTVCSTIRLFWADIHEEYKGTCALHISLKRLKNMLTSLGMEATISSTFNFAVSTG